MVRAVFCRQGAPAVLSHWVGLVAASRGSWLDEVDVANSFLMVKLLVMMKMAMMMMRTPPCPATPSVLQSTVLHGARRRTATKLRLHACFRLHLAPPFHRCFKARCSMAYVRGGAPAVRGHGTRSRSPRNSRGASEHAFVARTMTVGPFALEPAWGLKMGTLRALQREVRQYSQSPMSAGDLMLYYNRHHDPQVRRRPRKRSWPGCLEAIRRCVASYDGCDDGERQPLRDKMGGYALDLQCRAVEWSTPEEFLAIVADFIHNRWLQIIFKHALDKLLQTPTGAAEHGAPSLLTSWCRDEVQRTACVDVLTECFEFIDHDREHLIDQILDRRWVAQDRF